MTTPIVIAIDFDGTIVTDEYPHVGVPLPHSVSVIQWLKKQGHTIIINTCRVGTAATAARAELDRLHIPYDYFNENCEANLKRYGSDTRKISADLYIDDKGIYERLYGIEWLRIADAIAYFTGADQY